MGYKKKLPACTDLPVVEDSPPESEGNKTPSSLKKGKPGPKTVNETDRQ